MPNGRRAGWWRVASLLAVAGTAACASSRTARRETTGAVVVPVIRAERARFNAAIVARDTATIAQLLLPSYHVITGRSGQGHGVAEAMALWRAVFADSTALYVRRPREVRANVAWGLAEELGDWTGRLTAPDGPVRVSGSYAAKWQRDTAGRWRLQSEVFTTLACEGGPRGCVPPDAVAQ